MVCPNVARGRSAAGSSASVVGAAMANSQDYDRQPRPLRSDRCGDRGLAERTVVVALAAMAKSWFPLVTCTFRASVE